MIQQQTVSKAAMIRMAKAKSKSNLTGNQTCKGKCSDNMEGHLPMNTFEEPKVFECLELPIEGEESYRDLDGEVQAEKILLDTFDEMPSCFKRSWIVSLWCVS